MRLEHKEAGEIGAADEVVSSSNTHSERQGHNDLLKLSLPDADVAQKVVRHSSARFQC